MAGKAENFCDTGIPKVRQRSLTEKATSESTRNFFELVLIPIFDGQGIDEIMNNFYRYWFDALIKHGQLPKKKQKYKNQFLRGGDPKTISRLSELSYHAWAHIERGESIPDIHAHIRSIPLKFNAKYDFPEVKFQEALDLKTPANTKKISIPPEENNGSFLN